MIGHFSLEWLRARCADPRRFGEEEWFDFAGHLARGCRRCWSVVGQLPAAASPWGDRGGEPAAIKRSSDPLVESLYHLRSPGSWITLSSDLFEAVTGARVRPFGFVFVLLEEALELAFDSGDLEPLRKARKVIGTLPASGRHARQLRDLDALGWSHLAMVHAWCRRDSTAAINARTQAVLAREGGTASESVVANLQESFACVEWAFGYYARAEDMLRGTIRTLGEALPMRRFELWASIAQLAVEAGGTDRLLEALTGADAALAPFLSSGDPLVRLRAVFKLGRLAARLVEVDPEHELCRRRALVALETMEEDAAVMVDHADLSTRALWLLIQAKLAAVSDPERGEAAELLPRPAAATSSPASSLPRFVPESRP